MSYEVELIAVSKVTVGVRRRERVQGVAALKTSFERVGQIHPITVRPDEDGYELVAGQCRLEAARALGWTRIRARVGRFSDEQLREIELDENEIRVDLSESEASAARMKQIREAEAQIASDVLAQPGPKGGRPKGGDREVSRRTGMSRQTIERTRKHVAVMGTYDFLKAGDISRQQAMNLSEKLATLPARDRETVVEMVSEPGFSAAKVDKIITNAVALPAPERKETLDLYRSGEEEPQALAKTRLGHTPPVPWHRLAWLREMIRLGDRTLDDGRRVAQGELRAAHTSLKSVLKASEDAYQEFRKKEMDR